MINWGPILKIPDLLYCAGRDVNVRLWKRWVVSGSISSEVS